MLGCVGCAGCEPGGPVVAACRASATQRPHLPRITMQRQAALLGCSRQVVDPHGCLGLPPACDPAGRSSTYPQTPATLARSHAHGGCFCCVFCVRRVPHAAVGKQFFFLGVVRTRTLRTLWPAATSYLWAPMCFAREACLRRCHKKGRLKLVVLLLPGAHPVKVTHFPPLPSAIHHPHPHQRTLLLSSRDHHHGARPRPRPRRLYGAAPAHDAAVAVQCR